ncbi:hypothetical protein SV7mr_09110 [Stieleria bergensis]|uniref:Uncharacterized protein n=1 Tax=Stieleria bergensis TaxID=2528025 RepID=A0A517SQM9_9BACT|nr:hypothetical protein SV7mr_09110 [Planctomycetes bacterium SV_7m_r]
MSSSLPVAKRQIGGTMEKLPDSHSGCFRQPESADRRYLLKNPQIHRLSLFKAPHYLQYRPPNSDHLVSAYQHI